MRITSYHRAWIGILALSAGCAIGTFAAGPASAAPVAAHSCSGTSFTWTGNGDETSWGDASNWNPSGVPGTCDSVDIPIEANITGAPSVALDNFTIDATAGSDGTLTGGPLTVDGHFEQDGSSLETTINLPAGATGTIAGPGNNKGIGGGGLGIPGTINVSGSLILDDASGSGGNIGLGAGISQGLIHVEAGGTLTTHGPVSIAAGTAKTADSVEVGEGDQWVSAGTLTLPKDASIGATSCCGPTPGLKNTGTMTLATGGGPDAMTTGLDNTGTLKLASGTLAINAGSFQQAASGTLAVTFAGTSPGTGFGRLDVSDKATLAGKLLIGTSGGFTPPKGKPFEVLRYTSRTGKFGTLSGTPPYSVAYHATGMDVLFH